MLRIDGIAGALPQYLMMRRSQYWLPNRLGRYVNTHLAETLAAASKIPFYRDRADVFAPGHFMRMPILARTDVPKLTESVKALHPDASFPASGLTSGSTGASVSFIFDAAHQASRFAARTRYLRENGWSPLRRNLWIISTRMQSPDLPIVQRPKRFSIRFMSHLEPMEELAEALRKIDPVFLYSYPVVLDGLAHIYEARGERVPSLRKIFSGSEVLEDSQRKRIRRVFGVDVVDNYGSTEAFLAWECPEGSYHINAEHVIVEVVDKSGDPAAPGELGRVLVTTLRNRIMPLIRYEIGDWAVAAEGPCRCGRTLPRIGKIGGRDINLFVDRAGKPYTPWPLFRPLLVREWITQNQIAQCEVERFVVRYVGDRTLTSDDEAEFHRHFESILHTPVTIGFERMETIPRAPSGKFMMALNEMHAST
ncbi:MAG TPA: AMP-binding protein [Candidatus Binataceae bacterium]|nr:AMP-binding protein [Candidatus Binataceae bacterium]